MAEDETRGEDVSRNVSALFYLKVAIQPRDAIWSWSTFRMGRNLEPAVKQQVCARDSGRR